MSLLYGGVSEALDVVGDPWSNAFFHIVSLDNCGIRAVGVALGRKKWRVRAAKLALSLSVQLQKGASDLYRLFFLSHTYVSSYVSTRSFPFLRR